MAGIAFSGIASGLNTSQIIEALLTTDNTRINALRAQKTSITSRLSAVGTLKSKLSTLVTKLEAMRYQSQVMARTAASSNTTGVSATAASDAALGSFNVTVDQLATATRRDGLVGIGTESFTSTGVGTLSTSGLTLAPTAGRFTINGTAIDVVAPDEIQDFLDAINAATATTGVTADYIVDGSGNPTKIRLTTSGPAIQVGSAGDTSNFLTAAKLATATQVGNELVSTATLGRASVSATLATARLATALNAATGSFTINGVSFNWDSSVDSINSLATRINSSAANVTASYDAVSNRLSLVSKATGAQSIAVADTGGTNLMAALGATTAAGATETLGVNALYRVSTIAGGAQQSSTSNTVSGTVQGVTFTLLKQNETSTITVNQDTDKPVTLMKEFITAFNDAAEYIRAVTKRGTDGKSGGALEAESSVRMIGSQIRTIAVGSVSGLSGPYNSLMNLGVSSGAVGSVAGTTNNLQLDEAKFKAALASNPQDVFEVLSNATAGSEGILHQMRSYLNSATMPGGIFTSMTNTSNRQQTELDRRITESERRVDVKRSRLEAQFARMESAVAQLQAQGQRLSGQLSKLG